MPQFEVKEEKSIEVSKATFGKKDDYIIIVLKDDLLKKEHLVHKIHGQALINKKLATQAKEAKIDEREVENTVIKEPSKFH